MRSCPAVSGGKGRKKRARSNGQRQAGADAMMAALEAGRTRLRPVLMTALATFATLVFVPLVYSVLRKNSAPARDDELTA